MTAALWLLGLWLQPEAALGRLPLPPIVGMVGDTRTFHRVPLAQIGTTQWTHVETCGTVTLSKAEADGDAHIRLDADGAFVVAEIVPYHRLPAPKVGQVVRVRGISRIDKTHHWAEVHPVETITVVASCGTGAAGSRK